MSIISISAISIRSKKIIRLPIRSGSASRLSGSPKYEVRSRKLEKNLHILLQVFREKKSAGLALFFVLAVVATSAKAQFSSDALSKPCLSRNLEHDFFSYQNFFEEKKSPIPGLELEPPVTVSRKSPFLAGALSFILPGLGEYYVGDQIWRGIIFTAIDAGLLYGALLHNSRYNDSLNAWHDFANVHFLPCIYADSLNQQLSKFDKNFRISD